MRKHVKSHQTKRAKEEANANAAAQVTSTIQQNAESILQEISIKREKLSPGSSPNSIQRTSEDRPSQQSAPLTHFSLPQEVTIHVRAQSILII